MYAYSLVAMQLRSELYAIDTLKAPYAYSSDVHYSVIVSVCRGPCARGIARTAHPTAPMYAHDMHKPTNRTPFEHIDRSIHVVMRSYGFSGTVGWSTSCDCRIS